MGEEFGRKKDVNSNEHVYIGDKSSRVFADGSIIITDVVYNSKKEIIKQYDIAIPLTVFDVISKFLQR